MSAFATKLGLHLSKGLDPLKDAYSSPSKFEAFMAQLGWKVDVIPDPIEQLYSSLQNVSNIIDQVGGVRGFETTSLNYEFVLDLWETISSVFKSIQDLSNASNSSYFQTNFSDLQDDNFSSVFPEELVEFLLVEYLAGHHQTFLSILEFTGAVKYQYIDATGNRLPYTKRSIDWGRIPQPIYDLGGVMNLEYGWGTSDFAHNDLLESIGQICSSFFPGIYQKVIEPKIYKRIDGSTPYYDETRRSLSFDPLNLYRNGFFFKLSIDIFGIEPPSPELPGLALKPNLTGGLSHSIALSDTLSLNIGAGADFSQGLAMTLRPGGTVEIFNDLNANNLIQNIDTQLTISLIDSADGDPKKLFGNEDGSRLDYENFSIIATATSNLGKEDFSVEAELQKARIIIENSGKDGFLSKILPPEGLEIDFNLIAGISSSKGFYFGGSASLEVEIPIKKKIGNDKAAINFDSVTIKIGADDSGQIKTYASTSFSLMLGPLTASIDKIGMKADLDFPGSGGNLGPVDADIDFKFPNGVGLSIDSESFTGGGFLNFDKDKGRYVGGLELSFSKFSLAAIGIITTKLPDGEEGYSLLIIITADFNPVQIGMGFTLNGVGGLLGLHRTMKIEELRKGVKEKTLESILFPKEIVKNASRIISDMERVFPIKKKRFVFGPMGKIGWGTPNLVTIDIGIMIEVPKPVTVAILGILRAQVPPAEEAGDAIDPMLILQINFLGVIEFAKKEISFDASLFDSKIQDFPLEGDMALRIKWGETPNFLMSIGGFNNSFVPPPMNLPELRRLSINFSQGSDAAQAEIVAETYFAITSNTVQFGADIHAKVDVEIFKAEGGIGLHALFQFDPFRLQVNTYAWFTLMWNGNDIATVSADLTITGPGRWKIVGNGKIETRVWSGNGNFTAEFGKEEEPINVEPVSTWTILEKALKQKDNWVIDQPKYRQVSVAIKEIDAETAEPDEEVRIHPFGQLKFIQSQMPLNFKMKQYGNSGIDDYDKYWIDDVVDDDDNSLEFGTVKDYFAPAQFTHLSDDDKLSSPSFEKYEGGISLGSEKLDGGDVVSKTPSYEPVTIDRRKRVADTVNLAIVDTVHFGNMTDFAVETGKKNPRRQPIVAHDGQATTATKPAGFVAAKKSDASQHGSSSFATYEDAKAYIESEMAANPTLENKLFIAEEKEILELA